MRDTDITLRNKVIYQIFTRNYGGGTFNDVKQDLPRIHALGVDYIYLLPIHPSGFLRHKGSMGSPYAISDYRDVDPNQGTMESFIELSNAIHELGMKLMIDVVYNHTSPDSVLAKEHPEWFYHDEEGKPACHVSEWWDVIDLDYNNPELWDYQIETLKMWAKYVDGFRCDVAPMLPIDFWIRAREEVNEINPECIWLAESVEPDFIRYARKNNTMLHTDSEMYSAFDICYDYDIYRDMEAAMTGNGSLSHYLNMVNFQEVIYPENYIKLRCLENHDRNRAAALIPDRRLLTNWTAWNYFAKGTVMLYAGQEFCVTHHPSLFDKDTVVMETGKDISWLMNILSDIKKEPIFAYGFFSCHTTGINDEIIFAEYESVELGQRAIGIFSTSARKQPLHIDLRDGNYTNMLNGCIIDVYDGTFSYDGEPVILILNT